MGDKTKIQWSDASWNPIRGCSRVSSGCRNCYAERVAARFSGPGQPYEGLAERRRERRGWTDRDEPLAALPARWTGEVRMVPEKLDEPLRWKRPRRIFVNSMSDLFHEKLTDEQIAAVFGVMAAAPHHTFQVLTKRPERMRAWFEWAARHPHGDGQPGGGPLSALWKSLSEWPWPLHGLDADDEGEQLGRALSRAWPLPNVWLGVSVEDQQTADERIPLLLQTPAAVRFVSAEPLLGPVDLFGTPGRPGVAFHQRAVRLAGHPADPEERGLELVPLDWVIVGGEGPGARPCDVSWVRSIVGQCRAAGVACFVKQLGARPCEVGPLWRAAQRPSIGWPHHVLFEGDDRQPTNWHRVLLRDRKGGDPAEWPEDLRVREFPS